MSIPSAFLSILHWSVDIIKIQCAYGQRSAMNTVIYFSTTDSYLGVMLNLKRETYLNIHIFTIDENHTINNTWRWTRWFWSENKSFYSVKSNINSIAQVFVQYVTAYSSAYIGRSGAQAKAIRYIRHWVTVSNEQKIEFWLSSIDLTG